MRWPRSRQPVSLLCTKHPNKTDLLLLPLHRLVEQRVPFHLPCCHLGKAAVQKVAYWSRVIRQHCFHDAEVPSPASTATVQPEVHQQLGNACKAAVSSTPPRVARQQNKAVARHSTNVKLFCTSAIRPIVSEATYLTSILQVSGVSSLGFKSASPLQTQTQLVPATCRHLRLGSSRSQHIKLHSMWASGAAPKLTVRQAGVHCLLSEARLQPEWEATLTGGAAERFSSGRVGQLILGFLAEASEDFAASVVRYCIQQVSHRTCQHKIVQKEAQRRRESS